MVKSASQKFGFITCPELQANYGADCFCLGQQLAAYGPGDVVQFTVGLNREGKPQAIDITPVSTPSGTGNWGDDGKASGKAGKGGYGGKDWSCGKGTGNWGDDGKASGKAGKG